MFAFKDMCLFAEDFLRNRDFICIVKMDYFMREMCVVFIFERDCILGE